MATKKPVPAAAPVKKPGTAVVSWEERMAAEAQVAAAVEESTSTGNFFSTQGGQLAFNDNRLPNDEMAAVLLDAILENVYYVGKYDPQNPSGPVCFAFGRTEEEMVPHKVTVDAGTNQSDKCSTCQWNEWGSAETGRGKACRNTRRLAVIPAGTFEDGKFEPVEAPEELESVPIGFLKLPVTSVKGYAGFVKSVVGSLKRPPFGIFSKVSVVKDNETQFKVNFQALSKAPDEFMDTIMARRDEAVASIEAPYSAYEAPAAPVRGKAASNKAAPPARGKRY